MTLVMGSCRYHHLFGEEYTFPPRVHSTKEIMNVLKQYDDIPGYLQKFPSEMHSIIFGDINHPCVSRQSQQYIPNGAYRNFGNFVEKIYDVQKRNGM
jgi:predicted metal-binding protein